MNNKRIVILGGGESGTGAALLAQKAGMKPFVSDNGAIKDCFTDELQRMNIPYEVHGHTSAIYNADLVVKSPGIPDESQTIKDLRANDIEIISEIEFAWRFCKGKVIGITGANGKTTTTLLTNYIFESAGLRSIAAGNVGYSFSRAVMAGYDYYILEVSSFQLDGITGFKPHIAILTNITPDHLDRYHNSFQEYAQSKMRITMNQDEHDHIIFCADDSKTMEMLAQTPVKAQIHRITLSADSSAAAYLKDNTIHIEINQKRTDMTLEELALQGRHNVYNSMAAGVASRLVDIRKENIKQCLSDFKNAGHRLEKVATIHGVTFINDSKATNVNSTWFALESQRDPIIWIAGGIDKGNDYSKLTELVKERVDVLICLGKDNRKLVEAFIDHVDVIQQANSMQEAVNMAYQAAHPGETVLLSPACASFDLFENYEERGEKFIEAVNNL